MYAAFDGDEPQMLITYICNFGVLANKCVGGRSLKGAKYIFRDSIQSEQIAQASSMAWAREKALVSAGFRGQGDWTNSQRAELASSSRGKVKGFTAAEIHGRSR